MQTRNYETVFITGPNATESRLSEINAKNQQIIESFKGKILHLDDWGKRKMAYPINKENKGHYFCLTFNADTNCVSELERNMRITEEVVRFLTVKIEDHVDPMKAIAAYKSRLEAHAKREKERAERDAERRGEMGGGRPGGGRPFNRGGFQKRDDFQPADFAPAREEGGVKADQEEED